MLEKLSDSFLSEICEQPAALLGVVDRALAPAVAIVPVQLPAWKLAIERGLNPGTYSRASKVTLDE